MPGSLLYLRHRFYGARHPGLSLSLIHIWIRNVAVVWLLTGLWHGAAWNFVLWGGYFGLLLLTERLWLGKRLARAPAAVQHALLLLLVTLGFVLFRAESLQACGQTLRAMFGGAPRCV